MSAHASPTLDRTGAHRREAFPAWSDVVDEHAAGGRPLRGIGEPVRAGRRGPRVDQPRSVRRVHRLGDLPQIRSSAAGTVVRVHRWL